MMEDKKYKKIHKDENYVHCTICGNYRNINSFAHRKSYDHQNRLTVKLQKISFYLSKKRKSFVVIHDAHWPEKDFRRLCHFCGDQYSEHHIEDDFVTESLGSLYHHACSHHSECVKHFLKKNYRKEKVDKFCIKNEDLDRYLQKVPDAKQRYLKKMDFINNMILKQIRDSEEERKTHINFEQVESSFSGKSTRSMCENSCEAKPAVSVVESSFSEKSTSSMCEKTKSKQSQAKSAVLMGYVKNNNLSEVPPWLKDVLYKSSECQPAKPIIGPTFDTLLKHVATEKKNGLLKNRIGANFKHYGKSPSKWLPSYQGVWNQGRRKQLKVQFSRRNQN